MSGKSDEGVRNPAEEAEELSQAELDRVNGGRSVGESESNIFADKNPAPFKPIGDDTEIQKKI